MEILLTFMETVMTHLKALKFTTLTKADVYNPTLIRRERLVKRLEEQKLLAADQTYIPVHKRWKKNPDGSKSIVDHYRRIKPWWRIEADGNLILTVKSGVRSLEFEKGRSAVFVGPQEMLEGVIDTLIAATKAGELDRLLEPAGGLEQQLASKVKKVA
jgi:hypothetical protein